MKIKYFGHSAFLVDDLLIDPFIQGNPHCTSKVEDIKCKVICVTHDHLDHLGNAFEIAKNNDATIVAIHEIAELAASKGLKALGMNIGGTVHIEHWTIKMVNALHSSDIGHPAGFILKHRKVNKTIYHAGDTGLFSDMKLIGEEGIDIAMLPIGDRYTMGIREALKAVELIKPKIAIPIHYNTFPMIPANPAEFKCPQAMVFGFNEEKDV